mmetsp:Transcript_32616/g.100483  ORF Transcript_32616/g.100483 Transcript_32616/m.100483 type:complete len:94 (+) Transcript_32616:100-381(+)
MSKRAGDGAASGDANKERKLDAEALAQTLSREGCPYQERLDAVDAVGKLGPAAGDVGAAALVRVMKVGDEEDSDDESCRLRLAPASEPGPRRG